MIYEDLDKIDFPYLHKFFRRFKNTSNNTKNLKNTAYTQYTKCTPLISKNDIQKLNINHQNLLIMDDVDNQLNKLVRLKIADQIMKNINTQKIYNK